MSQKRQVFTAADLGSEEWKETQIHPNEEEIEENHRDFRELIANSNFQSSNIFYFIPVADLESFVISEIPTPFERIRTVGLFTDQRTICDRRTKGNEIILNLTACAEYPKPNKIIQLFGSKQKVGVFQAYFWSEVQSETNAKEIERDLLSKQPRYYVID